MRLRMLAPRSSRSLTSGLIQNNAGGDSGIQRLHAWRVWNHEQPIHMGEQLFIEPRTLIANEHRDFSGKVRLSEAHSLVRRGRKQPEAVFPELRNRVGRLNLDRQRPES